MDLTLLNDVHGNSLEGEAQQDCGDVGEEAQGVGRGRGDQVESPGQPIREPVVPPIVPLGTDLEDALFLLTKGGIVRKKLSPLKTQFYFSFLPFCFPFVPTFWRWAS